VTAEKRQAEALSALGDAMKRWGVKPEQLKSPYRELMAFTPDDVPALLTEPHSDDDLDQLELCLPEREEGQPDSPFEITLLRLEIGDAAHEFDTGDVRRLIDEVRRLRALVRSLVNPGSTPKAR
jgi:hypothetical protein